MNSRIVRRKCTVSKVQYKVETSSQGTCYVNRAADVFIHVLFPHGRISAMLDEGKPAASGVSTKSQSSATPRSKGKGKRR